MMPWPTPAYYLLPGVCVRTEGFATVPAATATCGIHCLHSICDPLPFQVLTHLDLDLDLEQPSCFLLWTHFGLSPS